MNKCFQNQKQRVTRKPKKTDEVEVEVEQNHEDVLKCIREEMEKQSPSTTKLKSYLTSCRPKRKIDAKAAKNATEHLNNYPALKKSSLVSQQHKLNFLLFIPWIIY